MRDEWPDQPEECPYGHRLTGAGQARVGWQPCVCAVARAHHGGHRTVRCDACQAAGLTTTAYQPEHLRTAAEVEQDLGWIRAAVARGRAALAEPGEEHWGRQRLRESLVRFERAIAEGERVIAARKADERERRSD
jgi:hypothetical protein